MKEFNCESCENCKYGCVNHTLEICECMKGFQVSNFTDQYGIEPRRFDYEKGFIDCNDFEEFVLKE